jgi:hypothetical protein
LVSLFATLPIFRASCNWTRPQYGIRRLKLDKITLYPLRFTKITIFFQSEKKKKKKSCNYYATTFGLEIQAKEEEEAPGGL